MRALHNSRLKEYREPFGAIKLGGTVCLAFDLFEEERANVVLRIWIDGIGEAFYSMKKNEMADRVRYTYNLNCEIQALYWYSFRIDRSDGTCMYYGAKEGSTGGEGQMYFWQPPSFQITCYKERKLPEWYKNAMVYQIFPDRFNRGKDFRAEDFCLQPDGRKGPERRFCEDWSKIPSYDKDEKGRMKSWEFYGGTLNGIREKLDYLVSIGVTAIYLNPIFQAASNHRYDTGDFMKIDSLLGTEEDFKELCQEAESKGISIILDGVFNHVGCDSKYFNKYGNYPDKGAWQGEDSPYRNWFSFNEDRSYQCWWGVDDLPTVRKDAESYRQFIYGTGPAEGDGTGPAEGDGTGPAVVSKWLRLGAKGFRLDVADELPDDFIAGIKDAVLREKGEEGLLMGEVWEDASNKISYSQLRKYFLGDELDCVMNYPFRDGIEEFIMGEISAYDLAEKLMSLYENYPHENFYGNLNLLGSHDRKRVLTLFEAGPEEGGKSLALGRLWLAVLTQMAMPGVPCIYYGDEAGLEGGDDPQNRGAFPWGREDKDAGNIYRNATSLRKLYPLLTDGDFEPVAYNDDVFGFYRRGDGQTMLLLINRSRGQGYEVKIKAVDAGFDAVNGAWHVPDADGNINLYIGPMGSALVDFSGTKRLSKPLEPGHGVLAHVTSIPGGTLGEPALEFIDFLAETGEKYWQILPLNPTDSFGSPYAGRSAFAGNVDLTGLSEEELEAGLKVLLSPEKAEERARYERFKERNRYWLDDYAKFCALKEAGQEEFYKYGQFVFEEMWQEVRNYAHSKGIMIIGDMPMYVSADSADVWANPQLFTVDEKGHVTVEAGVPPDYFSAEGQLWGNPIYKWEDMKADGFQWWKNRFRRAIELYDYTRLDHFRGFEAYWSVPKGKKAAEGFWSLGVGADFFRECYGELGELPFIAEDLGTITPGVNALREICGFYGADVMQFADSDPLEGYNPPAGKIAYSGTHDNETLKGWAEKRYGKSEEETLEIVHRLKENLLSTDADVVIMPLQDILELGDEARMNVPGVAEGNWSWRADKEQLKKVLTYNKKRNRLLLST